MRATAPTVKRMHGGIPRASLIEHDRLLHAPPEQFDESPHEDFITGHPLLELSDLQHFPAIL